MYRVEKVGKVGLCSGAQAVSKKSDVAFIHHVILRHSQPPPHPLCLNSIFNGRWPPTLDRLTRPDSY